MQGDFRLGRWLVCRSSTQSRRMAGCSLERKFMHVLVCLAASPAGRLKEN
jgi:hypothetical protein